MIQCHAERGINAVVEVFDRGAYGEELKFSCGPAVILGGLVDLYCQNISENDHAIHQGVAVMRYQLYEEGHPLHRLLDTDAQKVSLPSGTPLFERAKRTAQSRKRD